MIILLFKFAWNTIAESYNIYLAIYLYKSQKDISQIIYQFIYFISLLSQNISLLYGTCCRNGFFPGFNSKLKRKILKSQVPNSGQNKSLVYWSARKYVLPVM